MTFDDYRKLESPNVYADGVLYDLAGLLGLLVAKMNPGRAANVELEGGQWSTSKANEYEVFYASGQSCRCELDGTLTPDNALWLHSITFRRYDRVTWHINANEIVAALESSPDLPSTECINPVPPRAQHTPHTDKPKEFLSVTVADGMRLLLRIERIEVVAGDADGKSVRIGFKDQDRTWRVVTPFDEIKAALGA